MTDSSPLSDSSLLTDRVREEIARFDATLPIEAATPPPASWYLDPAFLALERSTTFTGHWQFAGRLDQVVNPGDYFTGSVLQRPYVVTRDGEGALQAFYNVCAHHGTCVAKGAGSLAHFTCPYHGWEYHLSGRLKRAPLAGAVGEFKAGTVGLQSIPVASWGPFVLLHFGEEEPDLSQSFAQFDAELDVLSMDSLKFVVRRVFELDCNWKVFVDNYVDGGYHLPFMHPALTSNMHFDKYSTRLGDIYSVQSCPGKGDTRLGNMGYFVWVHPNFMINRYGAWMDTNLVLPVDEGRCQVVFDYYHDGEVGEDELASARRESEQVQAEDTEIVHMVQRGLQSGVYGGLYAPRFETPQYQFHRLLAADFGNGTEPTGP